MTANELVDKLESVSIRLLGKETEQAGRAIILYRESAIMLRQQAKEIEDLKNANRFIQNFAEEQHRRAIALENELDRIVELYTDKAIESEQLTKELALQRLSDTIPYKDLHQVVKNVLAQPMRELTDEEIKTIYYETGDLFDFARAILKKAGEK